MVKNNIMVFDTSIALFIRSSESTFWIAIVGVLKDNFPSYVKPK